MNINVTEQTTTFPCPMDKLKGQLFDNLGMSWNTEHGELNITPATVDWIMRNVKTSMFNNERCYVYNKAMSNFKNGFSFQDKLASQSDMFTKIRRWADERGIYDKGDSKTQYVKLMEEAGELARALLKNDKPEVIDSIGDMVVVLTNLAELSGLTIEECIESAYEVISKRKGKMINGTFVKNN